MGRSILIAIMSSLLALIITIIASGTWAYRQGIASTGEEAETRLALYISYLQGVLEKYEALPELLAHDKSLVSFLDNPGSRDRILAFNKYLETVNSISDAADTYLMDREGLTIAASNWQEPRPFVGRNFSFRPYFQEAMKGQLGRYFALGATSSQRGYYFAYPVRKGNVILGTLVMKINIDTVEDNWKRQGDTFLVTDHDGVIFITTNSKWRYRTTYSLPKPLLTQIIESKRYPDASLTPLNIAYTKQIDDYNLISILDDKTGVATRYIQLKATMPQAGWEVQILSNIKGIDQFVVRTIIGVSSVYLILVMLILIFWQRQQQLAERHRFEEKTRKMLEDANEVLESRVDARTTELTESNQYLREEIEEHQKTESELRDTRKELIHTAKLAALGQMSAGIAHELNQPLAAIRTYSDNAVQLLGQERSADAVWNLEQIGELTERMAELSTQLKLFSRKTSGKVSIVPLHSSLDGALELLRPLIIKSGVKLVRDIKPKELEVTAHGVLLQQVFMNLISNGLHAVRELDDKLISISASRVGDLAVVQIQDNGHGIPTEDAEKIFDPFYTTKEPGQGLGLGLTITSRIVDEMGGSILIKECADGALFELKFKTP